MELTATLLPPEALQTRPRSSARRLGNSILSSTSMRSDSFRLLELLDSVLVTGPTGTNVRDLRVLLAV